MHLTTLASIEARIAKIKVLIVDDDPSMRRVVRAMLGAVGVKHIHEARDGVAGLDAILHLAPDVVIVDWEMPMLDGMSFVRLVRSSETFPDPDVPIIMLTGHGDHWRVAEAAKLGIQEYLLKPVSTKSLRDRIVSILTRNGPKAPGVVHRTQGPRQSGGIAASKPKAADHGDVVLVN
jgi:DNA-binding response OmpR family regulator